MRTSFHHQPEAQHPKSSAIHKLPADYPIFGSILLKKDFERGLRATLNQGERRTSNIDPKLHLLGFDCFKLLIPQLHFGDFFNAIDPNRTWPISKRREDCKIVLLRTAYQFDILQCTVSVCEGPDEFDQLHRRECMDGLAARQPRGHWRHTPSPAQSPSRQMFRRLSAAIG